MDGVDDSTLEQNGLEYATMELLRLYRSDNSKWKPTV